MIQRINEKISVIIPIYNVENYLRRCLESLACQDYSNFEVIMVDDKSTDNGLSIAIEYEAKYSNFHLVSRDGNGGLSAARNSGYKAASGRWITFVDSDDWVSNVYLSSMMEAAIVDNADVVMAEVYYAFENGKLERVSPFENLINGADKETIIAVSRSYATSRLFKKELFDDLQIKFPEDIKRSEDICTIIPVLTYSQKISLVNEPLYYYYQRKGSLSNTDSKIDVSFYPITVRRMHQLSRQGYTEELEYRSIHEILYGMVKLMIQSRYATSDIKAVISDFNKSFPYWRKNKYLPMMRLGKRIFVYYSGNGQLGVLRILMAMWKLKRA